MAAPKLVLYPDHRTKSLSRTAILQALQDLGLLGDTLQLDGRQHFLPGSAFLEHISFLGCAPAIALEPPPEYAEDAARAGRFCHMLLRPISPRPQLRIKVGQQPRCRNCRAVVDIGAAAFRGPVAEAACLGCGAHVSVADLNWRQAGGYARIFLDVYGIHTSEAVPGDHLLDRLGRATLSTWSFFYIED